MRRFSLSMHNNRNRSQCRVAAHPNCRHPDDSHTEIHAPARSTAVAGRGDDVAVRRVLHHKNRHPCPVGCRYGSKATRGTNIQSNCPILNAVWGGTWGSRIPNRLDFNRPLSLSSPNRSSGRRSGTMMGRKHLLLRCISTRIMGSGSISPSLVR